MTQRRLDLDEFFFSVKDEPYAIIKIGDFPNYINGSDIDIFCQDAKRFASAILSVANQYIDATRTINVHNSSRDHIYIDFIVDGKIEFRFDLNQTLPDYKRLRIKPHYIQSVIENNVAIQRMFDAKPYSIYVPSEIDDCLLRYIEYIEWYEVRPDKIKHLDHILSSITEEPTRKKFLDKLHYYTDRPEQAVEQSALNRIYPVRWVKFWLNRLQTVPPRNIPILIRRRICNLRK